MDDSRELPVAPPAVDPEALELPADIVRAYRRLLVEAVAVAVASFIAGAVGIALTWPMFARINQVESFTAVPTRLNEELARVILVAIGVAFPLAILVFQTVGQTIRLRERSVVPITVARIHLLAIGVPLLVAFAFVFAAVIAS